MDFLKKLFPQLDLIEWGIAAFVVAGLLGLFALQAHRIDQLKVAVATEKTGRATERATAAGAAASVATDRVEVSTRRIDNNQEIDREASRLETLRRADAVSVAALAADRGMRDAYRAVPRAASGAGVGDPGPVAVSDAGTAADDLRADVFDEWDGRASVLEESLDQAHVRGLACELEYASLKKRVSTAALSASSPE